MIADILLLAAFVIFIVAAVISYRRAKTIDYVAIGLALLTAVALIADRVIS